MKFSVVQEHLARGLSVVGHGVASRNTLPILSNVYIGTEDGGLRLVATNLEIAVTHWVPAKIEEKGATTIPARLFSDVVNGLPNEKIDIELLADGRAHLKCGRSASHLRTTPADDFPQVGAAGERVTARITQKALRAALDSTVFAAAGDEARPILTGVLTTFTGRRQRLPRRTTTALRSPAQRLPRRRQKQTSLFQRALTLSSSASSPTLMN